MFIFLVAHKVDFLLLSLLLQALNLHVADLHLLEVGFRVLAGDRDINLDLMLHLLCADMNV